MSLQPTAPRPRRTISARSTARRVRLDPPNTFQAPHHVFLREPPRPVWIESDSPELAPLPIAPLAGTGTGRPARSRKWLAILLASIALHAAAGTFFLLRGPDEGVLIAGAQEAGVAMYGDSAADMMMEGEDQPTSVAIVTMTTATPVATVDATAVEPVEATQPVTETATVVEEVAATEPVTDIAEPAPAVPADTATAEPSAVQQKVLAVDTAEIVPDDEAVAPVMPRATAALAPDEVVEVPRETVVAEMPDPENVEPPPSPKVAEAKPEPNPVEKPRPEKSAKKAEAKPAEKKPARTETPARKADKTPAAGSGGRNKADGRKGVADGEANGTRADKAGKGKGSAAGNAAVTNYPGKVRGKISRAVGRISRRDRAGAERDVTVAFTVTASGALGGLSIARSSGSASLDQAALAAVRRAAPFPAIPEGAGRKTWQFTIPLGLAK